MSLGFFKYIYNIKNSICGRFLRKNNKRGGSNKACSCENFLKKNEKNSMLIRDFRVPSNHFKDSMFWNLVIFHFSTSFKGHHYGRERHGSPRTKSGSRPWGSHFNTYLWHHWRYVFMRNLCNVRVMLAWSM